MSSVPKHVHCGSDLLREHTRAMQNTFADTPKEDGERAECYGLISDLFYGRADPRFLKPLRAEPEQLAEEPRAWQLETLDHEPKPSAYTIAFRELQKNCRDLGEEAIREEYEALFLQSGKGALSPYTSDYIATQPGDRHLSALHHYLVACGLARCDANIRVEDHVSAVCDVMRRLIDGKRPVEEQLAFFDEFVHVSISAFCDALETRKAACFYRAVAALARAFIGQELINLGGAREHELHGRCVT